MLRHWVFELVLRGALAALDGLSFEERETLEGPLNGVATQEGEATTPPLLLRRPERPLEGVPAPLTRAGYPKQELKRPVGIPRSIQVDRQTVLRWVEGRRVPSAVVVGESEGLPAGILIGGASSYGLGIRDTDRLVRVAGVPVSDVSAVVTLVLRLRAERAPTIGASFLRFTPSGVEEIELVVAQPYPEDLGEEGRTDALPPRASITESKVTQ